MIIALDLDDVLTDLITELIQEHKAVTGVQLRRDNVRNWDDFHPDAHRRIRHNGGYSRLRLLPGAKDFLAWLYHRHSVHIVTYRSPSAKVVTEQWLHRHVPGLYDGVNFADGSKLNVCRNLQVDIIIDDSVNQVPHITQELGIPGILFDTPMNRQIEESTLIKRASSYKDVRRLVVKHETTSMGTGDAEDAHRE